MARRRCSYLVLQLGISPGEGHWVPAAQQSILGQWPWATVFTHGPVCVGEYDQLDNGVCAHYVMVSEFQWKPFWLATQRDPQNDWTATQNRVNYDVFAQAPLLQLKHLILIVRLQPLLDKSCGVFVFYGISLSLSLSLSLYFVCLSFCLRVVSVSPSVTPPFFLGSPFWRLRTEKQIAIK